MNMARYTCSECGYVYDEQTGEPREGYPAGTVWAAIPDEFTCPDCAVRSKMDFIAVDMPDQS
jgi:rubredoxin